MKKISVIVITSLLLAGCRTAELSFTPLQSENGLEFHLNLKNVNGLLRATFWEGENQTTLWDVNLNYFPGPILKYGEIPTDFTTFNGNIGSAKQNYPETEDALAIPTGTIVYVLLDYQYDEFLSACATKKTYAFKLEENGTVVDMGEQIRLPKGQFADIWKRPQSPAGDSLKPVPPSNMPALSPGQAQRELQDVTPEKLVAAFVTEVSALAKTYPELDGFPEYARTRSEPLEVVYSRGLRPIRTKRGIRPLDFDSKGIHLQFMLRGDDNPVAAQSHQITDLPNLHLTLFADLALAEDTSDGLEKTLRAIIETYKELLRKLDKETANKAMGSADK